jgi:hypothetical protein
MNDTQELLGFFTLADVVLELLVAFSSWITRFLVSESHAMPEAWATHKVEFQNLAQRIDLTQSPRQLMWQGDLDHTIVGSAFARRIEIKLRLQLEAPEAALHGILQSLLEVCRQ